MEEIKEVKIDAPYTRSKSRTWSMGTSTTSRSFDLESWSYIRHKDYNLHVLQKTQTSPKRLSIPTSEAERLAYYRGYCTAPFKIQIVYLQQYNFSGFLWLYILNLLFRSLPVNYLHVFLAAYSPDHHLFASKMAPLCKGVSWQVLLCGVLQLVSSADILSLFLHYAIFGFVFRSPWNKCAKVSYTLPPSTREARCLNIPTFLNITQDSSFFGITKNAKNKLFFKANYYVYVNEATNNYTFFQTAPLSYFLRHWVKTSVLAYKSYEWIIYFAVLWILPALLYKAIFKRTIWKTLNYSQTFMNILYLITGICVICADRGTYITQHNQLFHGHYENLAMGWDYDMLADTITGPPVVHLLTSRIADQKIQPGRDSTLITASNLIFYLFRSFVNYRVKCYVESFARVPVILSWFNPFPIFTFWNLFYHDLFLGTIALRIFYVTSFLIELLIFTITFQIIVEVVVSEWHLIRRWLASIILPIIGLTLSIALRHEEKRFLYVFTTSITCMTELAVVSWIYSNGRLFDDMEFHFGDQPITARKWLFRIMPFYSLYKLYNLYAAFGRLYTRMKTDKAYLYIYSEMKKSIAADYSSVNWAWMVPVVPLLAGFFYSIIKYMIIRKQNWRVLLQPEPFWGPRDHVVRQLRKQFVSSVYVGSSASRYLSRYMLTRAETPTYRLDINYDVEGRRSTVYGRDFDFERKNTAP